MHIMSLIREWSTYATFRLIYKVSRELMFDCVRLPEQDWILQHARTVVFYTITNNLVH